MNKKFRIHKGDTVMVMTGEDKGKRGEILRVIPKKDRVIVSGVNIVKKAMKKRSQQDQGGIIEIEAPIHISNVALVDKNGVPTRVGYKIVDGKKIRISRKTGEAL